MNNTPNFQVSFVDLYSDLINHIDVKARDCYPNNNLDFHQAHPAMLHISKMIVHFALLSPQHYQDTKIDYVNHKENISQELDNCEKNSEDNFIINYIVQNNTDIFNYKNFCYPDGNFSKDRVHSSLQRIRAACNSYDNTYKNVLNHIIKKEPLLALLDVDLLDVLTSLHKHTIKSYNHVYPDGNFYKENASSGMEQLRAFPSFALLLFSHLKLENLETIATVEKLKNQVQTMNDILSINDISGTKAHYAIDEFAELYKQYRKDFQSGLIIEKDLIQNSIIEKTSTVEALETKLETNKIKKLL